MNRIKTLFATLLLASATTVSAQEVVTIDRSLGTSVEFDETQGMTIRYDSLLNDWKVKTYLYVDDDCHGTDIDPTFPDSVYIDRLQRIPAVIELPYNHIVRQYIDRYTKRLRKSVSVMLGAGNFYFPIFEAELERYGLPLELKYLPVIESALKPKAVSPAGAGGLWQFMVGTAKQYGLKVNSVIDERCDPVKGSEAAARLLRDLYRIYNDWALVLAAYNCGPGNVNRAIHRAGARDYWQIYPYLPKETRGYVPAFIAATYAMTYYCEHGICPMRARFPIDTDTIIINRDISLRQISDVVGIDMDLLKSLNPQYRTDRIPGKSQPCILRMPDDKLHAFLDYGDDVYRYRASELLARRAEVSVRGERNPRTPTRTQQPASPGEPAMAASAMPSIANTEAVVPPAQPAVQTQTQRSAIAGEVIEVEVADTPTENGNDDQQGSTTISLGESIEGELQPVKTTTQRAAAPVSTPTTARAAAPTSTTSAPASNTPAQRSNSTGSNTNRQRTRQQTTTKTPAQAQTPAATQGAGTQRNRQQANTGSKQQATQSGNAGTTQRNRQQQTAAQGKQQTTGTSGAKGKQQTTGTSGAKGKQQTAGQGKQQTQSSNSTTQRNRQQQSTGTAGSKGKQTSAGSASAGSKGKQQQQATSSAGSKGKQQQQATGSAGGKSKQQQQATGSAGGKGKQQQQATGSTGSKGKQQQQAASSAGSKGKQTSAGNSAAGSKGGKQQTQSASSGTRGKQATTPARPAQAKSGKAGSSKK
ncbi:MAG: transglycosylase SLT domain-containing protein [Bacteroidaceae bacterium]|nr:transglycosylase SLT domain-containing protein [Bacteroidaceae bacterium]